MAQAFSALLAMVTAFVASPVIAWATRGRYYLAHRNVTTLTAQPVQGAARRSDAATHEFHRARGHAGAAASVAWLAVAESPPVVGAVLRCTVCQREYEAEDMTYCPAYVGNICSLCCSLDARCHDQCKPDARLAVQWRSVSQAVLPRSWWPYLETGLGHFLLLMAVVTPLLAALLAMIYTHEAQLLGPLSDPRVALALRMGYVKAYAALLLLSGIVAWWLVLTHKSRQVAQEESNRQTQLLVQEIESHRRTDEALQQARQVAEQARHHAELANEAKTRYVSAISHELRTPLNSILGYAQLLDDDATIPANRRPAVATIRRSGDHLLSLIEGTLDVARIESGKLTLDMKPMRFREGMREIADMFELQASSKGLAFVSEIGGYLPEVVRADEKRVRQIVINVLGNAVKFTRQGRVVFRVQYAREMAVLEIEDTGPGMDAGELASVFEPFARGSASGGGSGLGLTISKMLTELMGGEMTARSTPNVGTVFRIRLFLPEMQAMRVGPVPVRPPRVGYEGARQTIWVVDNEQDDRDLLVSALAPMGFEVRQFGSGTEALAQWRIVQGSAAMPHAVFMDLAMPGIDGWTTLSMMQDEGLSGVPVAIVSANAFEKGSDNEVGITEADFLLKPVRIHDILDWLGKRLALRWRVAAAPARDAGDISDRRTRRAGATVGTASALESASVSAAMGQPGEPVRKDTPPGWPPALQPALAAVVDAASIGYPRGVQAALDEVLRLQGAQAAWVERLRELTRRFQFDEVEQLSQAALAAAQARQVLAVLPADIGDDAGLGGSRPSLENRK